MPTSPPPRRRRLAGSLAAIVPLLAGPLFAVAAPVTVCRQHLKKNKQQARALQMSEELVAEADSLVGSLEQAGDVGHRELSAVRGIDGAEDRRERRWRTVGPLVIGDHDGPRAADVAAAEHLLTAQVLDRSTSRVLAWLDQMDEETRDWRDASVTSSRNLVLTAAELAELLRQIDGILDPYRAGRRTDAPADARTVHVHLSAVPSTS